MHTGKTTPQMCLSTGSTDDVPSLTSTVVVHALLRTNMHTPLHHTRGCSTELLFVVWGMTQPGTGAWSWDRSLSRLGHLTTTAATVTMWMNTWGVTQPGQWWSLHCWEQTGTPHYTTQGDAQLSSSLSLNWATPYCRNCNYVNEYLRFDPAWTVVVPALLRTNRHTPLHHTRGCSTELLLVVWGVTQPGTGAWSWDQSLYRL